MKILDWLKGRIMKMLGKDTVIEVIKAKPAISNKMEVAIQTWSALYEDNAPWLKEPTEADPERVTSLGLPAFIASEKARMATLEMESEITPPMKDVEKENPDYIPPGVDELGNPTMGAGSMTITESEPAGPTERADFLNKQYNKLLDNIREQLEYGCAKGGLVIKPYLRKYDEGSTTIEHNELADEEFQSYEKPLPKYEIEFDYIQADRFFPMAYDDSGKITEAVFIQTKSKHNKVYSRLEYHKLEGRSVTVENYAFVKNNVEESTGRPITDWNTLGKQIPLTDVAEWADLSPSVRIDNVDRPLFAYFKMPEANTIDTKSPLGVSCYSRVVNLIKDADEQYSRLMWEFEGGELAVDVDRDALRPETYYDNNGQAVSHTTLPAKQQRLFRKVDLNSEETYNVFSPALRDVSLANGLNLILMRIEDIVGFSRGTLSEQTIAEAKTATELKILKQRSYSANEHIQKALEKALKDTVYIMDVYCTLYNITPPGEYEMSFEWDDSILVDKDSEADKRMAMIDKGLSSKLEFRMWYFGETENQAKQALQKIDDEKKASMEINIVSQKELGETAQGKDLSGDNNNPTNQNKNSVAK